MTPELVAQARTGDEEAFRRLVEPHRRELTVHCYRILGSMQDAEDALQDTLVAAWQGLNSFEHPSSLRSWLYRIATTRSLNAARSRSRHHHAQVTMPGGLPEPNGRREVTWLEPFPDNLLEGLQDQDPGPEARYESKEAISLAFITTLQMLSPLGRAVLILRDVLGFHTTEVALILQTTEGSVASALKRARSALRSERSAQEGEPAARPRSAHERDLVERFTRAFEATDLRALVALLTEDVRFAMPPLPFEWLGPRRASEFLQAVWVSLGGRPRLVPTRANGQPAFALYAPPTDGVEYKLLGILVLTVTHDGIRGLTRFEAAALHHFALPVSLERFEC